MMLRSSSTPILGSLLSSSTPSLHSPYEIVSRHHHYHPFPYHFSPPSDGCHDQCPSLGIRRSRSDTNLNAHLSDHYSDDHHHTPSLKSSSTSRRLHPSLETIPSFSVYTRKSIDGVAAAEENDGEIDGQLVAGACDLESEGRNAGLRDSMIVDAGVALPPLFLARGLGIDRIGSGLLNAAGDDGGSSRGGRYNVLFGNGGEQSDMEMYYKKMVEENPSNGLFLRNYAEFLYQNKGDLKRAEEYCSRAILADPNDGEILSKYAKLVWELHRDEERASSYFQQAVQAAPEDSHVHAAYAGFLWETEDDEDDRDGGAQGGGQSQLFTIGSPHYSGALAPIIA